MSLPQLSTTEQRVLGCLLEKQITVPASYPLTLNSLRLACNQSSSRDPVLDLDERTVEHAGRALRELGLAEVGWADSGRRTRKYSQTAVQALHLTEDERAVLTVLLLRGPQTPGELNSRTDRLHAFADKNDVEQTLARMAARELPLVLQLERQAGQHDRRWMHLLAPSIDTVIAAGLASGPTSGLTSGPPAGLTSGLGSGLSSGVAASSVRSGAAASVTMGPPDGEAPLRRGGNARDEQVRTSYGVIASEYAEHARDAMSHLPFETFLLDRVAAVVRGEATGIGAQPSGDPLSDNDSHGTLGGARQRPVVDVGCGTGVVTSYLASRGVEVTGIDLTPEMIERARTEHPELTFEVGDLRTLMRPPAADGWGAVLAWYCLMHLADSELPGAMTALARPLASRGVLAVALFGGVGTRHNSHWLGHDVDLTYVMRRPEQLVAAAQAAGLVDIEWYHRSPIAALAETTERLYLIARKP